MTLGQPTADRQLRTDWVELPPIEPVVHALQRIREQAELAAIARGFTHPERVGEQAVQAAMLRAGGLR